MAKRMHFSELERMLADPTTSDEELAGYLKPARLRALPPPPLTVDATLVMLRGGTSLAGPKMPAAMQERFSQRG